MPDLGSEAVAAQLNGAAGGFTRLVTIGVRELGPVLKLLSSAAVMEGGTEVVLQVATYAVSGAGSKRGFTVHWKNGGPVVLKGVAGLRSDVQAALHAGLQPGAMAK